MCTLFVCLCRLIHLNEFVKTRVHALCLFANTFRVHSRRLYADVILTTWNRFWFDFISRSKEWTKKKKTTTRQIMKETANQHKLFCMSKNDSQNCPAKNTLLLVAFHNHSTERIEKLKFTLTDVHICVCLYTHRSNNDNIYYLIWNENLLSFEYIVSHWTRRKMLVVIWYRVYELHSPSLHEILMKLPLFIEFIRRFYWVHRKEPISTDEFMHFVALHSALDTVVLCIALEYCTAQQQK